MMEDGSEHTFGNHRIITLTISAGETPERIDQYLARTIANSSRTKVQSAIDAGLVTVNGETLNRPSYKIKGGDVIVVRIPHPPPLKAEAEDIPLDILYEDDDILIINKPAGIVVHPSPGTRSGTVVNALLHHIKNLSASDDRPGIVHRLDKDTSGLMVIAKNEHAHRVLAKQFFHHTAHRIYTAIVWGEPKQRFGTIQTQIGRDPRDRKKFAVVTTGGKEAITEYIVTEYFHGFALLELKLQTGRTHQIRVHCKHIGHPVFGDPTYNGRAIAVMRQDIPKFKQRVEHCLELINRQALHAKTLRLNHPRTGELMEWTSDLPDDMQNVIKILRK